MPKIAQSACCNTNSKEPWRQFATQAAKKNAPQSSLCIRQVRQGQELDPDYNVTDLEFDSKQLLHTMQVIHWKLMNYVDTMKRH